MRNFTDEMKAIFSKHTSAPVKSAAFDFVPENVRRFNVLKQTETNCKAVEFGITMPDVLRAIEGRYRDTETVRFRIVHA